MKLIKDSKFVLMIFILFLFILIFAGVAQAGCTGSNVCPYESRDASSTAKYWYAHFGGSVIDDCTQVVGTQADKDAWCVTQHEPG